MKSLTLRYSDATVRDLNDMRDFLESAVLTLGGSADVAGDLVLAVNEAITNSLLHGYDDQPGEISLSVETDGADIVVRLTDKAPLFDPTSIEPPDINLPLEERPLGGLGIHMMRQLTDDLSYRAASHKNELTFVKLGALAVN